LELKRVWLFGNEAHDARSELQQHPGVDVEEAQIDLGVLQVCVVERRHFWATAAVTVGERDADIVRGGFYVLRDQDTGTGSGT
jgi:hypothetical protein